MNSKSWKTRRSDSLVCRRLISLSAWGSYRLQEGWEAFYLSVWSMWDEAWGILNLRDGTRPYLQLLWINGNKSLQQVQHLLERLEGVAATDPGLYMHNCWTTYPTITHTGEISPQMIVLNFPLLVLFKLDDLQLTELQHRKDWLTPVSQEFALLFLSLSSLWITSQNCRTTRNEHRKWFPVLKLLNLRFCAGFLLQESRTWSLTSVWFEVIVPGFVSLSVLSGEFYTYFT